MLDFPPIIPTLWVPVNFSFGILLFFFPSNFLLSNIAYSRLYRSCKTMNPKFYNILKFDSIYMLKLTDWK